MIMDWAEIEHRNAVLRAYFDGRDWGENNEFELKWRLIRNSQALLPGYPYLIEDEWEIEPNRCQEGKGDLVFTDGHGRFAVVELKWIGDTDNRTHKRGEVKAQASRYARILAQRFENAIQVEGYSFTDEDKFPVLQKTVLNERK